MPPIKNWSKESDKTWKHDTGVLLQLTNSNQTHDGRHSLWFARMKVSGEWDYAENMVGEEPVQGAINRSNARKEAVSWMRENPELDL